MSFPGAISPYMMPDLKNKVILTDCDGVLLDWKYGFYQHMAYYGLHVKTQDSYSIADQFGISKEEADMHVRIFNNSKFISRLTPFRDAIASIKYLHENHGFVLHVITALSTEHEAYEMRLQNLHEVFGANVIDRLVCTDPEHPDKTPFLDEYKDTNCIWVEDSPKNAIAGAKLGLNTYSINHSHNADFKYDDDLNIECVDDWQGIISHEGL